MWSKIWFISNSFFVFFFIVYLFTRRNLKDTVKEGVNNPKTQKLSLRSKAIGSLAIVSFVVMVLSFIINMRVNQ